MSSVLLKAIASSWCNNQNLIIYDDGFDYASVVPSIDGDGGDDDDGDYDYAPAASMEGDDDDDDDDGDCAPAA
ncbi:hypothetical protein JCGZ_13270 [Jatropha curcas]|uniref:Uncharacterized protein n=1 Tax=Jatropha curcas TaxID=180498 RepID=A0A067KJB1_JATCU|nr:hypothetical protein JCGZ_13270 [Jatropha curcas]